MMKDSGQRPQDDTPGMVAKYLGAAINFGKTQQTRDFEAGNDSATELERIGACLRDSVEGRAALMQLLQHENAYVRLWAAKDALAFSPEAAVAVLEVIEEGKGLLGTSARMTLAEWRAGRLFKT